MNRVDEIIVFRKLDKEDLKGIVSTEINKVTGRLKDRNLVLNIAPEVLDFIIEKGYKPEYGARPIRRAVQQYLEDSLAEEILRGTVTENMKLDVMLSDNKLVFIQDTTVAEAKTPEKKKKVSKKKSV
jgi:ATP-dependent Clp protease ATP-binding subunit ClpC